ncbi:MAG: bacteriohemerythrin [Pseudomonadota bacterium]
MSIKKTRGKAPLPSLRKRYFTITLILALLVLSTVSYIYSDMLSARERVSTELEDIHERLFRLDNIRTNMTGISRSIDLFLLDPSQGDHDEKAYQLISNAIQNSIKLIGILQQENKEVIRTADELNSQFVKLSVMVSDLFDSRMDISRQYPGMAISAFQMTEPQRNVGNKLKILIEEIEKGELEPVSDELYSTLQETYPLWLNQISQMRIYMANRFASFSKDILVSQANSLHDYHQQFLLNIEKLEALYAREDSFEGADAIKEIKRDAVEWHDLFEQLRTVHESDRWRTDSYLMTSKVIPKTDDIFTLILDIEKSLTSDEKVFSDQLRKSTDTLSLLLFIISALFLLFIAAIIISLDRMVFRPIANVVDALRLKAFNKDSPQLHAGKSREISYLIDAYQEMDKQVNQRQEELQVNERLLRTIAENYPNAYVSIIEKDLSIGFTSGQEFKKQNLDPNKFIGQSPDQIFGEDSAVVRPYYEETFQGKLCSFELFINDQYQLYHTVPLYSNDGLINQILVVAENITERKMATKAIRDSEERYRTIFEGAPEGVWVIGPTRQTIEVNRRLCEILGYQRDEMIGKVPLDFADEDNQKIFKEQIAKIGTTERREYEIELRHKEGHNVPTKFSANTLYSSSGDVLEAVAFVTDLTEQKIAEKTLRSAQKMDAIGKLTGGIAHDFNNILGVILGNLELLKQQMPADDKNQKRLASIEKAGDRAANLTKQLLGFSRRKAALKSVTDINKVIAAMESLIVRSVTPEVEVEYHFADDLWLTEIDPGDFEDVLLNLSINARDAMDGHGYLTLKTRNRTLDDSFCDQNVGATPGEYVELTVSDSGEGISPEQQEHIFEPFYTTKEQGKGTGLGLAMVYGFVKRSSGYINVYSELGHGTTFRLYLPRTVGEEKSDQVWRDKEQTSSLPGGTETLLVVDDEVDLLELARESLEMLGYRVLTAVDGQEAMEKLAEEPAIDLLFSDVVMPGGMNGYDLAEQAIASRPEIKVLLTSGYTEKAISRGGQAYFTANLLNKPYSQVELAHRVRAQLGALEQPDARQRDDEQLTAQKAVSSIKWTDALSVGLDEMDNDHRELLDLLHRSQQAVANSDESECSTILEQVQKFTQIHFRREEVVMAACGYPGLDNHRQVHELLLSQVEKMQSQLELGELNIDELAGFLARWWVEHIQGMDRAFAQQCQGKDELIKQALELAAIPPLSKDRS